MIPFTQLPHKNIFHVSKVSQSNRVVNKIHKNLIIFYYTEYRINFSDQAFLNISLWTCLYIDDEFKKCNYFNFDCWLESKPSMVVFYLEVLHVLYNFTCVEESKYEVIVCVCVTLCQVAINIVIHWFFC